MSVVDVVGSNCDMELTARKCVFGRLFVRKEKEVTIKRRDT